MEGIGSDIKGVVILGCSSQYAVKDDSCEELYWHVGEWKRNILLRTQIAIIHMGANQMSLNGMKTCSSAFSLRVAGTCMHALVDPTTARPNFYAGRVIAGCTFNTMPFPCKVGTAIPFSVHLYIPLLDTITCYNEQTFVLKLTEHYFFVVDFSLYGGWLSFLTDSELEI